MPGWPQVDSLSCVAYTSLLPSSSCSRPFMVSHAGTFRDPMGPPQGPSRYFLGQPRTHRSDPLWHAEFLVSEIDDACPWAWYLHSCFSLGLWVGVALPPLPGPCSAPRPCLGGSGWAGPQDPDPRLPGGLLALPPLGATPLAPPAKFPRGCLIRRALAAHSWVWFFAVSGCSLGAVGEAGVTGQSDEWSVPRLAPC